jgi:hypothetical protein
MNSARSPKSFLIISPALLSSTHLKPCSRRSEIGTIPTLPGREGGDFITLYNTSGIGIRAELNGFPVYVPDGACRRIGPLRGPGPIAARIYLYDRSAMLDSKTFRLAPCNAPDREGFLEFDGDRDLRPLTLDEDELPLNIPMPQGFDTANLFRPAFEDDFSCEQDADYDPRLGRIRSGP